MTSRQLLKNPHLETSLRLFDNQTACVRGSYEYYHYGCDGIDDRGWGCGYRTLQSLCSWVKHQQCPSSDNLSVPTLKSIQEALATMGDKPEGFVNSKEWIGSFEVCLCLDFFYNVPCKILHIAQGKNLRTHLETIWDHFEKFGSPIMMGGDTDNSSKGILGVSLEPAALLIMDPHFYGNKAENTAMLAKDGWIKWVKIEDFVETSFYNLCLPQLSCTED